MFQSLTDAQWAELEPLFTAPVKRGRGKPHAPWRAVLNSVLAILLTGIKWGALPKTEQFASKSASHRWFIEWDKNGLLVKVLDTLRGSGSFNASLIFTPRRRNRAPAPVAVAETEFATA